MLKLEGIRAGLPKSIYGEEVISEEEIEIVKERILELIERIKENDEIFNPYSTGLSNLFKDDAGFRTRQFKILNNNIKVLTLVNSDSRPKVVYDGQEYPISTRQDIEDACNLTKEQKEIQSYKIKFFNDHIRPAILEHGKEKSIISGNIQCLTVSELGDILSQKEIVIDRQRLQETILKPLSDHGFLEKFRDPDNNSRDIYMVADTFLEKQASIESTLIDTSTLDDSCVKSFVNKYLEQRFNKGILEIKDENGNKITPNELVDILCEIVVQTPKNRHKIGSNEASMSNENEILSILPLPVTKEVQN